MSNVNANVFDSKHSKAQAPRNLTFDGMLADQGIKTLQTCKNGIDNNYSSFKVDGMEKFGQRMEQFIPKYSPNSGDGQNLSNNGMNYESAPYARSVNSTVNKPGDNLSRQDQQVKPSTAKAENLTLFEAGNLSKDYNLIQRSYKSQGLTSMKNRYKQRVANIQQDLRKTSRLQEINST